MEQKFLKLWMLMALPFGITACSSDNSQDVQNNQPAIEIPKPPVPNDNERKDIQLSVKEKVLVGNNNDFAFNLFRQLNGSSATAGKSQLVSPLSITCALGMLNNGAAGETKKQIVNVLGFGDSQENVNEFAKKMMTELPALDNESRVALANTIFVNQQYQLLSGFVEKARQYYQATPETREFTDGKTLDAINQWASDNTQKMISQVLSSEEFNPTAVSYLLNATYFKGSWTAKFDKEQTTEENFDGAGKKVPMMHLNNTFNYMENETCQALRLPYGNTAYAMTVLLPKNGKTVKQVAETLTATSWTAYQQMAGQAEVDVKLPRFETNTDISLKEILSAMGMPDAFNIKAADFSQFCNVATFIEIMKQVSKIKVDEEGSEAAAVTVIESFTTSADSGSTPLHVNFHANRPFLYVISEQSTGAILFIGQYMAE